MAWFRKAKKPRPVRDDRRSNVPEGLWGYETKGDVKACALDAVSAAMSLPGCRA